MLATETAVDLVPTWIEPIATLVGVVVAIAAIVFTVVQLRLTAQQMRETATQEAKNSEARTRPYVGIEVVPGIAGSGGYVNPTWPLADGQKWTHLARAQRQSSAFRAPAQVPAKGASSWR